LSRELRGARAHGASPLGALVLWVAGELYGPREGKEREKG
jgi:hypothetical protein